MPRVNGGVPPGGRQFRAISCHSPYEYNNAGPNGDAELARLLRGLRARRRPDDLASDPSETHEE